MSDAENPPLDPGALEWGDQIQVAFGDFATIQTGRTRDGIIATLRSRTPHSWRYAVRFASRVPGHVGELLFAEGERDCHYNARVAAMDAAQGIRATAQILGCLE